MTSPRIEQGIVVGTASNKYKSRNPIARFATNQLLNSVTDYVVKANPKTVLEIGCGEGFVTERLLESTEASIKATDLSATLVSEAEAKLGESDRLDFAQLDIYDLDTLDTTSDVVVCCEVLEHLDNPKLALELIARSTKKFTVLSVPREPNFRILNFCRGQHFRSFGNAPGHIQHWSKKAFLSLVEAQFDILEVRALLPWTVVLASPRWAK